ncbi:hypothetical protein MANI_029623 [Metarhizium anisopliae]
MFDSPLGLLPPSTPQPMLPSFGYFDSYPAIGEEWNMPQQHQLPSPPSTPPTCADNVLQTPDVLPHSRPLFTDTVDLTKIQSSPTGLPAWEETGPERLPASSPRLSIGNKMTKLADCDIGETEEGLEWYRKLRAIGLDSFQIRIVWKFLCGLKWKQIASEESEITEPCTHDRLGMKLSRWRDEYPLLNELVPFRKPSRKASRKASRKPSQKPPRHTASRRSVGSVSR